MAADHKGGIVHHTGLDVLIDAHIFEIVNSAAADVLGHQTADRSAAPGADPLIVQQAHIHTQDVVVRRLDARARVPERQPSALLDRLRDDDGAAEAHLLPFLFAGVGERLNDQLLSRLVSIVGAAACHNELRSLRCRLGGAAVLKVTARPATPCRNPPSRQQYRSSSSPR